MHTPLLCDSLTYLAAIFGLLSVGTVSPDTATFAGALFAAALAMNDARKTEKDRLNLAAVGLASVGLGSVVPGALLYNAFPEFAAKQTFHAWAFYGVLAGMMGWLIIHVIFSIRDKGFQKKDALANIVLSKAGIPLPGEPPPSLPPAPPLEKK